MEKETLLMQELSRAFNLHAAVSLAAAASPQPPPSTPPEAGAPLPPPAPPELNQNEREYQRRLATALLSQALPPQTFKVRVARSLLREIVAFCIIGPVMKFVAPYYVNLGLAAALAPPDTEDSNDAPTGGSAQTTKAAPTLASTTAAQSDGQGGPRRRSATLASAAEALAASLSLPTDEDVGKKRNPRVQHRHSLSRYSHHHYFKFDFLCYPMYLFSLFDCSLCFST